MAFRHPNAQEWALDHSLATPVSYGRLAMMAFQHHPDIYSLFGLSGALIAEHQTSPRRSALRRLGVAFVIVMLIIGAAAPVTGAAVLVGDRFGFSVMDASRSVPIAGICFAVASAMQIALLIIWLVGGARFDWLLAGPVVVAVIFAVIGVIGIPASADRDGFDGWDAWYPTAIACLALSVLLLLGMLTRLRVRAEHSEEELPEVLPPVVAASVVRSFVIALPVVEHEAILSDRDAGLAALHSRGLITLDEFEHARAQPMGTLFTLDTEHDTIA